MPNHDDRDTIFELLYLAFIDIREDSLSQKNAMSFHLADLFHIVPKMLKDVDKNDYGEIIRVIKQRANERGAQAWLKNSLEQTKG